MSRLCYFKLMIGLAFGLIEIIFKVFVIFMISQEVVRNVGMKIHEFFDVWKRGGQTLMYTHIVNVGFFLLFTCFGSLISTLFIFNSTRCVT